ncbi:capsular polysaccharide synthesis protein [Limosilactobacillus vaginalis]|uniref:capsular polysaccharide synthesis protein n=1 Tax=Limosilactobacillus vaginalis TaxID=1633 RepID=UPI003F1FAB9A
MNNFSFIFYKVLRRIKFLQPLSIKVNKKKHARIMDQLLPLFIKAEKESCNQQSNQNSNIIWLFWWQGEESMPVLVKKCYHSIQKNSGNNKVILISKFNIRRYAKLPEYVYTKLKSGEITYTHFSDILRFNLLLYHGGLWLDATCYVTSTLDKIDFKSNLFTVSNYNPKSNFNVSQGRWTGFLIGGPSGLKIFSFMNKFFCDYWKENNRLIDFFLIDYALAFAWNNDFSNLKKVSKQYNGFLPYIFELQSLLDEPYDSEKVIKILDSTNFIFKMSNRRKIKSQSHANTLFNHL